MRAQRWIFALVLFLGILTLWVDARWAWGGCQIGFLGMALWRSLRHQWKTPCAALGPLIAACGWIALAILTRHSVSPGQSWVSALDWFTFSVVFALAADLFQTEETRLWILHAIAAFGMVLAAVSTIQNCTSAGRIFWMFPSGYPDGVMGPFVNHGQYSAWAELVLPVALYLAVTNTKRRSVWGTAVAVLFGSILAAASRAGCILAMGELLAGMGWAARRGLAPRERLRITALQIGGLVFVATAVVGYQTLWQRLSAGGSEALRADGLRASIEMVETHPWFGTGLGTWATVYPAFAHLDTGLYLNQAHDDWAQWAAEGGLPFLGLLLAFAVLCCRRAVPSIFGLGIAAVALHAFVDYPMQQRPMLAAWFFAIAGISAVSRREPGVIP